MDQIFYPESIVIIGLSGKPTNIPRITLENLLRWGYRGRIFGVNPRSDELHVDGIKMYKDIEDLPEVPDLAFCLVPAPYVPDIVTRCGQFGIKRMAISSGGFSEFSAEGKILAEQTLACAHEQGIRFVGPNGLTVANTDNGLCLPFVPLHRAPKGEMSIIFQSGGVSLAILNYLLDENIGLAKFVSMGNKLDLDEVDYLEYLGNDPHTGVICIYLESMSRGREFIEAARRIDKPIVVYKGNVSVAGKKAAMSHTAAISNDEDIIDSAFEEAGVIRVYNILDFIEVTKVFRLPPMRGRRVVVMSPAGGFSVLTADLCEKEGFEFADMGTGFYESLKKFSNAGVINFSNPLDMGDIYDPQLMAHVIYSVMHSEQVDGTVFLSQRPQMPQGDGVFQKMFLSDLSKEAWGTILSAGKPLGVCLFGSTKMIQQTKRSVEFPVFNTPEKLVKALSLQMKFYERKERMHRQKTETPFSGIDHRSARAWLEGKEGDYGEEILDLLSAYGIPVIASSVASNQEEAVNQSDKLGYPVAMKVISPDALHKTDAGGVALGINDPAGVGDNFKSIHENLLKYKHDARFEGVRIQKMAPEGYDMFVGGKHDPSFGPVVYFGLGGIFMELFADVANVLCPASSDAVQTRLERLKAHQMLEGLRGSPCGDIDAFVDLIMRVSHLLWECPQIQELDINPVRVFYDQGGAMALDARARIINSDSFNHPANPGK